MPLNKDKLQKAVESALEEQKAKYDDGDTEAITPEALTDSIVDHMHGEIEAKLKELIKINIKLLQTLPQAFGAVTPAAGGAPGASIISSQMSSDIASLNKLLTDINRYSG